MRLSVVCGETKEVNLALKASNYEYVRIMSKATGKTKTRFINDLIAADQRTNAEIYDVAKSAAELSEQVRMEITRRESDK